MTPGICTYCHAELAPEGVHTINVEIHMDGIKTWNQVVHVHTACVLQMVLKLARAAGSMISEVSPS